jgi:hypothetical protein
MLYDALVADEIIQSRDVPDVQLLSGEVLTFLNKIVFPVLWCALLIGIPLWVFATTGRISVAGGFRFIVVFALIATVLLSWLVLHLQRVGHCGRDLVVDNYLRQARIPFDDVEAVEPVWWYRGRLVRIRFRHRTPFGSLIYYMPKWGPMRAMFDAPEKDLQRLIWPRLP